MYSNKSIEDAFLYVTVIIILVVSVKLAGGAPDDARVKIFPGYRGNLASKIYTGYVTINEAHGRALFYYFVESERNSAEDPVILWLTGGPGCSSFTGFAYELGPMHFDVDNYTGALPTLSYNPHTWTKVSNIIFLDSPAGTGFSYSNTTEDYVFGAVKIVSDAHTFLIKWFEAYPEFLSNPLYIGGDSFSGIVVPMLTQKLADDIEAGVKPILNLKGYLVGNGLTDNLLDKAQVPFAHGMALISDESYEAVKEACNGNYSNPTNATCLSKLLPILQGLSELNSAHILEPKCFPIRSQKHLAKRYEKLEVFIQLHEARKRMFTQGWFTSKHEYLLSQLQLGYLDRPCPSLDKYQLSVIWANDPFVRKAIHAQSENITGKWMRCTPRFKYIADVKSVVKYHENLTRRGYHALIYSGDHDMLVPFIGTQAWIRSLGYAIVDEWRSWFVDGQVAGYTRTYANNLTFATVKGGGHTAPEYKPRQSFVMFKRWSSGEPL